MLKQEWVIEQLSEIANVYPTVRGLMNMKLKNGERLGVQWAKTLAHCNKGHFSDVCDEVACLKIAVPDPADRLPFVIQEEVQRRSDIDFEKLKSMEIRMMARSSNGVWASTTATPTGRIAVSLGEACKSKQITPEENKQRLDELMAWDEGGPKPEWLSEYTGDSNAKPASTPFA